jgi:hypothetical protein
VCKVRGSNWYASDFPHGHYWRTSLYLTLASGLVSWSPRRRCHVPIEVSRACFTSASVASRQSARCFFRVSRDKNHWSLYCQPEWLVPGDGITAGSIWAIFPTVQISCPVIFSSLGPFRNTWLVSDLQQTPTWNSHHLLFADIGERFILSVWALVGQTIHRQRSLCRHVMCTVCCNIPCIRSSQIHVFGTRVCLP